MEITELHTAILIKIHDSENENLNKNQFAKTKINHPDLEKIIDELEGFELVEFELKENSYYLTYEGYELVEKIKNPPKIQKINRKSNAEEYNDVVNSFGGVKNFNKFMIVVMLIVGILFSIMFYLDSTY